MAQRALDDQDTSPAEIEQDAYTKRQRELQHQQEEAQRAAKEQAKLEAKAEEAAVKAQQAERNNALEAKWRAEGRPFYSDANGNLRANQTDEAWKQAVEAKAAKAAETQKKKDDAAREKVNRDYRAGRERAIEADESVLAENDQSIRRHGQELKVKAAALKAENQERIKTYNKLVEEIDKGESERALNYPPETVAKLRKQVAKWENEVSDAERAVIDHEAATLEFDREQDSRRYTLKREKAAVAEEEAPDVSVSTTEGVPAPESALRKQVGELPLDKGREVVTQRSQDFSSRREAWEQRNAGMEQQQAQFESRRQEIETENQRLLTLPHTAADVSEDGWHVDLVSRRDALYQAWDEAGGSVDGHRAEAEALNAELADLQDAANALNAKQKTEHDSARARQKQSQEAALSEMEKAGHGEQAAKLRALNADTEKRLAEIERQHGEGTPEREAALKALDADVSAQQDRALGEIDQKAEIQREKLYQELNALPGAAGAGDELAKLDAEMKPHLGGDDAGAQEYYQEKQQEILNKARGAAAKMQDTARATYAKLADKLFEENAHEGLFTTADKGRIDSDPDRVLTAFARESTPGADLAYEEAVQELTTALGGKAETLGVMGLPQRSAERQQAIHLLRDMRANDWSSGSTDDPVRYDSRGGILVNPTKYLDEAEFKSAVEGAEGTPEQKQAALKQFPELNQQAIKAKLDTLRTTGVYRDWEAQQEAALSDAGPERGEPAEMSDADRLAKFEKEHSGFLNSGAWQVRLHQALMGIGSGVVGLAQSAVGIYEAVTRSREAMTAYKSLSKTAGEMAATSEALPTGQWFNKGTNMVVSTVPSLAIGGVVGSARSAFLKNATKKLTLRQVMIGGKNVAGLKTAAEAAKSAQVWGLQGAAAAAGLQTFGSMYGNATEAYREKGLDEDEALNRAFLPALAAGATTYLLTTAGGAQGVEALLRQPTFKANFAKWFKAVTGGAIKEGLLEEAPDQFVQGVLERHTFNPRKSWSAIAEETLEAGIGGALMGTAFEAMNTRFSNNPAQPGPRKSIGQDVGEVGGKTEAQKSAEAMQAAFREQDRLRQSPQGAALLRGQLQAPVATSGAPESPAPHEQPETKAAAEAAIDSFTASDMKPAQVDEVKAKAKVVLAIAQGAKLGDLTEEQLREVGLNRDGTRGHYEKVPVDKKQPNGPKHRVWTKGEGQIQPVVLEDGELIITQRQIDNLARRLPAVAKAIGLSEVERRQAIAEAKKGSPGGTVTYEGYTGKLVKDGVRLAVELPDGTLVDVADPSLLQLPQKKKAAATAPIARAAPAKAQAVQGSAPVVAPNAPGAVAAEVSTEPGEFAPAPVPAPGEEESVISDPKVAAEAPEADKSVRAPLDFVAEERAEQIGSALADRGLTEEEARRVATAIVGKRGVVGDSYVAQMVESSFDEDMKELGYVRDTAGGRMRFIRKGQFAAETKAQKPALRPAEKVTKTVDGGGSKGPATEPETGGTPVPQPAKAATKKEPMRKLPDGRWELTFPTAVAREAWLKDHEKKITHVATSEVDGAPVLTFRQKREKLIERADWRAEMTRAKHAEMAAINARRDRAVEKGTPKAAADQKLKDDYKAMNQRLVWLEQKIDDVYGDLFDAVKLVSGTTQGGMAARAFVKDEQGRALAVALEIDLVRFLEGGSLTEAGIDKTLDEEFQHLLDLMVSTPSEAIELARGVHAARPGVFNTAWKAYWAFQISESQKAGLKPGDQGYVSEVPPKDLSDDEAYHLYFETSRMIRQGNLTTENVEMPNVLEKIRAFLQRYVKLLRRQIRQLPKDIREPWEVRLAHAEALEASIKAGAREAAASDLDEVEPPAKSATAEDSSAVEDELAAAADEEIDKEAGKSVRAPAKAKRPKKPGTWDKLQAYYREGAVVPKAYGKGWDKVLQLNDSGGLGGSWRVQVQDSDKDGKLLPGTAPRWHSTAPSDGDLMRAWNRAQDAAPLAASAKRSWTPETKQVQDASIDGIFSSLYGTGKESPSSRDSGNHGRGLGTRAAAWLEREVAGPGQGRPEVFQGGAGALESRRREEGAVLADWARENGVLLTKLPESYTLDGEDDIGAMEHHVWPSPDGQRVVKLTRVGDFGLWPVVVNGNQWELRTGQGTPLRYLQRLNAANDAMGDDWVLHGVLVNRRGQVQILTSQPHYDGALPDEWAQAAPEGEEQAERDRQMAAIASAMRAEGFERAGQPWQSTYYRAADNTAVFDAHLRNVMWVPGETGEVLVPFDVTVMKPAGRLRENLERAVGGQPLAAAAKRRSFGPELEGAAAAARGLTRPAAAAQPVLDVARLRQAYDLARVGQSSDMLPLKRIYDALRLRDPGMQVEDFLSEIARLNEAGAVLLGGVETTQALEKARPFVVGANGTELAMAPERPRSLSAAAKRSFTGGLQSSLADAADLFNGISTTPEKRETLDFDDARDRIEAFYGDQTDPDYWPEDIREGDLWQAVENEDIPAVLDHLPAALKGKLPTAQIQQWKDALARSAVLQGKVESARARISAMGKEEYWSHFPGQQELYNAITDARPEVERIKKSAFLNLQDTAKAEEALSEAESDELADLEEVTGEAVAWLEDNRETIQEHLAKEVDKRAKQAIAQIEATGRFKWDTKRDSWDEVEPPKVLFAAAKRSVKTVDQQAQTEEGNSFPPSELSHSSVGEPRLDSLLVKPLIDGVLAYTDLFGDFPNAKTLLVKGFNQLNGASQRMILAQMRGRLGEREVLRSVIKAVPVDVMNMLIGKEWTPEGLLHNPAMLTHRLAVSGDVTVFEPVAAFVDAVAAPFKNAFALGAAEKSDLSAANGHFLLRDDSATSSASNSTRGHVITAVVGTQPITVNVSPTPGESKAGNYLKGDITIGGHNIRIETPAGMKRKDSWPPLKDHYGYFAGTNAKDGDAVDVFVRPGTPEDYDGPVHVVRQVKVEGGKATRAFDEYKTMLGYPTATEAKAAYLRNYEKGWPGFDRMTTHSSDEFKRIKEAIFVVPKKEVPGVRESDRVLNAAPKRGEADDLYAEPRKGILKGLSDLEWAVTEKAMKLPLAKGLDAAAAVIKRGVGKPMDAALNMLAEWSVSGNEQNGGAELSPEAKKKALSNARVEMARAWNKVIRQITPDRAIPVDVLAKRREMRAEQSLANEKALDVGKRAFEGKAKFTDLAAGEEFKNPELKRQMFLAMNGKIDSGVTMDSLTPKARAVAEALAEMRRKIGRELVREGRLSLEAYERMEDGMPHFYEHDVQNKTPLLKRMRLGLGQKLAQRGTAFHMVDLATKDAEGQDAIVPWTPPGKKKSTWNFKTKEQMDGHYEEFIQEQILAAKNTTQARSVKDLDDGEIRALKSYGWMTGADRTALAGVTREKLRLPATMTKEQRAVVERLDNQLRRRYAKRAPLSYIEHEKAGLIMDPFYAIGRQLAEAGHDLAVAKFFNYIAGHPEYARDDDQKGYTQMPDTPRMGRLAGKWVRDDVAAELLEITEIPGQGMQLYDWLMSLFKYGHTVLNAGSHVRNVIGNISFAHLAGNNPLNPGNWRSYGDALKVMRDGGADLEKLHKLGIIGGDYLSAEVKRTLRQLVPDLKTVERQIENGNTSWLTGLKETMARKVPGLAKDVASAVTNAADTAWKFEDDIYKVAAFLKAKEQGMTDEHAAAHVRKWFTFYDGGSSGSLKALGRFVFPFLSFKRESLRILGNGLREKPITTLFTLMLPRLLTQLSLTAMQMGLISHLMGDNDDEEKRQKDIQDILKYAMKGHAGRLLAPFTDASLFSILLPFRDASGGLVQWDLSAVHPFSDWLATRIEDDTPMPWWQRVAQDVVSGTPFLGLVGEIYGNKDSFSGRNIWEKDESTSEQAWDLTKHAWNKLAPPHLGAHYKMIENSLGRSPSKLMPTRSVAQTLSRIFGVDLKPAVPDLYRERDDYQRERGVQVTDYEPRSKDAAARARAELYRLLIQDEKDQEAILEELERLEKLGKPILAPKQVKEMFDQHRPETLMAKKKDRAGWIKQLGPESRRVLDAATQQQKATYPGAMKTLTEALVEARKRRSYGKLDQAKQVTE